MSKTKISYKRHLLKTISYRLLSTGIGFFAMWWATGSIKVGVSFGILELIYKPIQYYIHERVWYRWIKFGIIKPIKRTENIQSPKEIIELPKEIIEIQPEKKVLNYNSNR
jgi:uncharacterized membrane protein